MSLANNRKSPEHLDATQLLQSAERSLEQSDLDAAEVSLNRLCKLPNISPQAFTLAGLLAVRRNKYDEAAEHFVRALEDAPGDFDARYNLALANYLGGDYGKALKEFRTLSHHHPHRAEPLNDMGVVWQSNGRIARALACFGQALKTDCNYVPALDNALQCCLDNDYMATGNRLLDRQETQPGLKDTSRARVSYWRQTLTDSKASNGREQLYVDAPTSSVTRRKLAFFASHRTFITDIVKSLAHANDVRIFEGTTVQQMNELLAWADLAWFEWCDDLLIQATRLPKQCPIVCRLHSYEAFTDMPSRVDWGKIDHLVFVNQSVRDLVQTQIRPSVPSSIVHNGVDCDRFAIPTGKRPEKKIASVGYINYKKNPTLLLYCFKKIYEYDRGYSLHIAGEHQDSRIQLYFEHFLRNNPLPVHFDGWVKDMPSWYADKDFVISTSLFESFHYSIAEGMASGLLPLVHNWYGADNLYPRKFLFEDPDDCLKLLKRLEKSNRRTLSESNRAFIRERYDFKYKLNEIASLIERVIQHSSIETLSRSH
jgi:glycosyltransferase involved in cell wall biosynthesis/Tfp pilus assembly protein PilF